MKHKTKAVILTDTPTSCYNFLQNIPHDIAPIIACPAPVMESKSCHSFEGTESTILSLRGLQRPWRSQTFYFCLLTFNGDLPATEKQIEYLKSLQEVIPEDIDFENLTGQEAFRIYYFKDYSSGIRKQDGQLAPAKKILA